jgi:hypothetical protein
MTSGLLDIYYTLRSRRHTPEPTQRHKIRKRSSNPLKKKGHQKPQNPWDPASCDSHHPPSAMFTAVLIYLLITSPSYFYISCLWAVGLFVHKTGERRQREPMTGAQAVSSTAAGPIIIVRLMRFLIRHHTTAPPANHYFEKERWLIKRVNRHKRPLRHKAAVRQVRSWIGSFFWYWVNPYSAPNRTG